MLSQRHLTAEALPCVTLRVCPPPCPALSALNAGFAAASSEAVAEAINEAFTCNCACGPATARALADSIAVAGGCGQIGQALAGTHPQQLCMLLQNCSAVVLFQLPQQLPTRQPMACMKLGSCSLLSPHLLPRCCCSNSCTRTCQR